MTTLQTYETTIGDRQRGWAVHLLVLPRRSLADGIVPMTEESLRHLFDLSAFHTLSNVSQLPRVLSTLVAEDMEAPRGVPLASSSPVQPPPLPSSAVVEPDLFAFAEEVCFADQIPFETSPLGGHSLASIIVNAAKGGAAPLGALTAYVAIGASPLLLIAVPAGIILCGGAITFGKWLDAHRNEVFAKVTGVQPRRRPTRSIKLE